MCDEEDIIRQVRAALSKSPAWSTEGLVLAPDWRPLVRRRWRHLPTERAIYVFGLKEAVAYEKGGSHVIYIGSSTNLSRRITQHRGAKSKSPLRCVMEVFDDALQIAWWPTPEFHRDWLRGIEAEALWLFEKRFGTIPICNLDIPNTDAVDYCHGLVRLRDWARDQPGLTISTIGEKIGRIPELELREPYSGGFTIVAFIGKPDEATPRRLKFRHVRFYEPHVHAAQFAKTDQLHEENDLAQYVKESELFSRSLIHDVNLAAWSSKKMTEVIGIACQLDPAPSKAKTLRKLVTTDRSVPVPHTWGEVALIAARLLAGTWQPEKRVWVQVVCGKEVLGDARLNKGWYVGEDKSDLPQSKQLRERVKGRDDYIPHTKWDDPYTTEHAYGLEIIHEDTSVTRRNEETVREALDAANAAFQDVVEGKVRSALRNLSYDLPGVFDKSRN